MGARKSDGRGIGTQVGIHFFAHIFLPAKRRAIAIEDLLHSDPTSSNAIPNNIGPLYVNMADSVPENFSCSTDLAVVAAQQAEIAKLTQTRQNIETLYQKREAGYLKEQQHWEQFVQNVQSILETAAREWNDLRLQAQSALAQSDQDQLRFRDLALAKEQERLREHADRWYRDLEDLHNVEPINGESLLDAIQVVLDFAGFVPVLGAGPDAINTIISAGRGNWGDAAVNAIAIIPFWGDGAKAGKMLAKAGQEGVQHADEVAGVVNAVAKNGEHVENVLPAIDEKLINAVKDGDQTAIDAFNAMTKDGEYLDDLIAGFDPTKGFASFTEFKSVFGAAGKDKAWHHVVEQTINSGKFAPELLHNPANLFKLPHGPGSIHEAISAYYSSKIPGLTGEKTFREWLSTKSFMEQFEYGIEVIKTFGGKKYLPSSLQ